MFFFPFLLSKIKTDRLKWVLTTNTSLYRDIYGPITDGQRWDPSGPIMGSYGTRGGQGAVTPGGGRNRATLVTPVELIEEVKKRVVKTAARQLLPPPPPPPPPRALR